MKKLFFVIFLVPLFLTAQEITPSSSMGELPIEIKVFMANVEIENQSIVKDLVLKASPLYQENYLSGNFGTIRNKAEFSLNISKVTSQFIFASRAIKIGDAYKLVTGGGGLDAIVETPIMDDVKTRKIMVQAEFTDPSTGQRVRKLLEINFEQEANPDGDEVLASATITSADLGLNVMTLKVESPVNFTFSLQNRQYDVNMVIKGKDQGTLEFLASKMMPDGVHSFVFRMGLPNGISMEETLEAFVHKGEVILENSSFNPLSFADGDKANFSGKKTLVRIRNSRNEDVIIFIPSDYIAKGRRSDMELRTDAFSEANSEWRSYVVASGKTLKLRLKTSSIPTIVYGMRSKNPQAMFMPLEDRNSQRKYIQRNRITSN